MAIQHIHASLDDKLIRNADRYFTAGLAQIIDEIVQNARRAGARNLSFALVGATLTVIDDGRGLSADMAHVLLRLGGSNNTETVEAAENAAGMGFFSMARYGVTVRSRDWQMTARPEAFNGSAAAELATGLPLVEGLQIEIPSLNKAEDWTKLQTGELVLKATRYSGLRVTLSGFVLENGVHEPAVFLDQARAGDVVAVREAHGTTIKVIRGENLRDEVFLNFYGKVIEPKNLHLHAGVERLAYLDTTRNTPTIRSMSMGTRVLIDVQDTSCLKLQLPERNHLIENDGLQLVLDTVRDMQREILRRPGVANGLPMNHPLRVGAADLPAPQIALNNAIAHREDYNGPVAMSRDGAIVYEDGTRAEPSSVISANLDNFYASILEMPRARDSLGPTRILDLDDMTQAFPAEALTTIQGMTLIVRAHDEEFTVDLPHEDADFGVVSSEISDHAELGALDSAIVQDLALSLELGGVREGESQVVAISAFYHSPQEDVWNPSLLVVPDAQGNVVAAMMRGINWYNDEQGDYEGQESAAEAEYAAIHAAVIGRSDEALLADLEDEIRSLIRRHMGYRRDETRTFDVAMRIRHDQNGIEVVTKSLSDAVVPLKKPGRKSRAKRAA